MTDPYDIPITVHWHCGCFVGEPKWHGEDFEPDECNTDFDTDDSLGEWQEKGCTVECPSCHAELGQTYDAEGMTVNQPVQ